MSTIATEPTDDRAPRAEKEFGTLSDLCLSHRPGERPELFGEFRPISLVPETKTAGATDSMDKLSLSKSR